MKKIFLMVIAITLTVVSVSFSADKIDWQKEMQATRSSELIELAYSIYDIEKASYKEGEDLPEKYKRAGRTIRKELRRELERRLEIVGWDSEEGQYLSAGYSKLSMSELYRSLSLIKKGLTLGEEIRRYKILNE